ADAQERLMSLKARLRELLRGNVDEFETSWETNAPATEHVVHLPNALDACLAFEKEPPRVPSLCMAVWQRLSRVITEQIAELDGVADADSERDAQTRWGERRARVFTGRSDATRRLDAY